VVGIISFGRFGRFGRCFDRGSIIGAENKRKKIIKYGCGFIYFSFYLSYKIDRKTAQTAQTAQNRETSIKIKGLFLGGFVFGSAQKTPNRPKPPKA
jgi:hypothetical protein